jgi:hypothetical protein
LLGVAPRRFLPVQANAQNGRAGMTTVWRLSAANGLLLAAYFVPVWTRAALAILAEPIRGLYANANIAPAMFVSDHLQWLAPATLRFAWILALAKLTVAMFFLVAAAFTIRAVVTRRGDGHEALLLALLLGGLVSVVSLAAAVYVGEHAAVRLHATELLMLLGANVVMLLEPKTASETASHHHSAVRDYDQAPTTAAS